LLDPKIFQLCIKKYFNELQSEVSLYENESDEEKNLSKNKVRDTKDEK